MSCQQIIQDISTIHGVLNWRLISVVLLLMIGISIRLITAGWTDPPHATNLYWQGTNTEEAPDLPFTADTTVDITAHFTPDTDQFAEWGLWLENDRHMWIIIAINRQQYVTARVCPINYEGQLLDCPALAEPNQAIHTYWKYFRHIQPDHASNTIRLYYDGSHLQLFLNKEWMWDIPYTPPSSDVQWGVWHRGGQPVIEFITLRN